MCRITENIQFGFHSLYVHRYLILARTVETLHKTPLFLFHFLKHVYSTTLWKQVASIICSPCIHLESHWTLTPGGPARIAVLMRHHQQFIWMGQQETVDTCTVHIFSAHIYVPLSHQTSPTKHKFKDRIIKNFKTATSENSPSMAPSQAWGPMALRGSHVYEADSHLGHATVLRMEVHPDRWSHAWVMVYATLPRRWDIQDPTGEHFSCRAREAGEQKRLDSPRWSCMNIMIIFLFLLTFLPHSFKTSV